MNAQTRWSNEARNVFSFHFAGDWQWDVFENAMQSGWQEIAQVHHPVTVVIDSLEASEVKSGVLQRCGWVMQKQPAQVEQIVVVSRSRFLRLMVELYQRLYARTQVRIVPVTFVNTREELVSFLAARREASPPRHTSTISTQDDPKPIAKSTP